ncbi:MAG: dihydroorotate dehydrogenase electron transfer subunit [Verrucomicrobia bacterium]|nr:dihydroorotate dehydrogenase electron transfer subunit [Verrucomicrobiota bacterium]
MQLETALVTHHGDFAGEYKLITFAAPGIAAAALPGQFLHIRIPALGEEALRRPFSIYRADEGTVSVMYKPVGRGTDVMAHIGPGAEFSLIGPLGTGFPYDRTDTFPVFIAGGYGVAPLSLLAKWMPTRGIAFLGGKKATDILCAADFEALGWDVEVTTEDGSLGTHGLVTDRLDVWLAERRDSTDAGRIQVGDGTPCAPAFYGCGPQGLMQAIGDRALANGWQAWLSLDRPMGCGIGACLACVQKVKGPDGKVKWARCCREGPVFDAKDLVWD